MEDVFLVLTQKEKEVLVKRFSLNNQPRHTLERIGQAFNVTRERIRQIEKIALGKLRRTLESTKLRVINAIAKEVLQHYGSAMREDRLVEEVLKRIPGATRADASIVRLSLCIDQDIEQLENVNVYHRAWYMKKLKTSLIQDVLEAIIALLMKKGDVVAEDKVVNDTMFQFQERGDRLQREFVLSLLEIDLRLKKTEHGWGLMSWRHINPKSIRDKAYIVLKKAKQPLHFMEIAKRIEATKFDHKRATVQAVHNELIRYDQFVLVGRGLYALKEWGYKSGTVADIIAMLLKRKSPMSKQDIIAEVLKHRQVKKGTISLNLQKNPHFVRVGRAVYALDEKVK